MAYGLAFFFNSELENEIMAIQRAVSGGVSLKPDEPAHRPHIAIAIFNETDIAIAARINELEAYCASMKKITVKLSGIGAFPEPYPVVFLPLITNEPLLRLHGDIHRLLANSNHTGYEYYLPGNWFPHCSLHNTDNADTACSAFNYLLKSYKGLEGFIAEFDIVDFGDEVRRVWSYRVDA